MSDPKVFWSEEAMSMLGTSDRYSRQGIFEDFRRKLSGPDEAATEVLKSEGGEFRLTPVLKGDYRVVWVSGPGVQVNVVAVVKKNAPKSAEAVKKLIASESLHTLDIP